MQERHGGKKARVLYPKTGRGDCRRSASIALFGARKRAPAAFLEAGLITEIALAAVPRALTP